MKMNKLCEKYILAGSQKEMLAFWFKCQGIIFLLNIWWHETQFLARQILTDESFRMVQAQWFPPSRSESEEWLVPFSAFPPPSLPSKLMITREAKIGNVQHNKWSGCSEFFIVYSLILNLSSIACQSSTYSSLWL